jgi:hypothetical protein
MRRLLAIVLAAGPFAAQAQTAGAILFDGSTTSTINAAECSGQTSAPIALTWTITPQTSFVPTGEYRIFAGNGDLPNTAPPYCYLPGVSGQTAAKITPSSGTPVATGVSSSATVSASALAAGAGYDCTTDQTIFVCVLWYQLSADPNSSPLAYAKGKIVLSVAGPGKPTVTSVTPGDGALNVWATTPDGSSGGNAIPAVAWRAKAVAGDGVPHFSAKVAVDASARIGGLVNGVPYTVTAFSYSANDNESPESDPFGSAVAPQPAANAWEVYKLDGGRDTGGCQSGGAGLGALLGAAALLGIRRRS